MHPFDRSATNTRSTARFHVDSAIAKVVKTDSTANKRFTARSFGNSAVAIDSSLSMYHEFNVHLILLSRKDEAVDMENMCLFFNNTIVKAALTQGRLQRLLLGSATRCPQDTG